MFELIKELWFMFISLFKSVNKEPTFKQSKFFPFKGYMYMMWCGYILYRKNKYASIRAIKHEQIHINQAKQCKSYILFYISYLFYYIVGLFKYFSHKKAYLFNPYELEAYGNEHLERYPLNTWRYKEMFWKRKFEYNKDWYNYIKTI